MILAIAMLAAQQPAGEVIDLMALADPCRKPQSGDEIVVCARTGDPPYRLAPEMRRDPPPAEPLRLGIRLAPNADAAIVAESVEMPGARSQRAMVRMRLRF